MEEFAQGMPVIKPAASSSKPLLGLTILLIEDSRYFSDAVRLLAIRSGARLRRADCLSSAGKHIKLYRPDAVIVDLGLPDGSGLDFIEDIRTSKLAPPVIAISGNGDETKKAALAAGAQSFIAKPFYDLAAFQQSILSVLPKEIVPRGFQPRMVGEVVEPDTTSLAEDLSQIKEIISQSIPNSDVRRMHYCVQFLSSTARITGDKDLISEADVLAQRLSQNAIWENSGKRILKLIETRLSV